jgi:nucleoid-associated protein YgaU
MDRLEELKRKYQRVLDLIKAQGVVLAHLHLEKDKLFLKGRAPSAAIKNRIWDEIKQVDPAYADLTCDLTVDETLPQPPPPVRTYTVVKGDSLWKIASHFYGNGAQYPKIIAANPAKLKDEKSVIHPGDVLVIPD